MKLDAQCEPVTFFYQATWFIAEPIYGRSNLCTNSLAYRTTHPDDVIVEHQVAPNDWKFVTAFPAVDAALMWVRLQ